MKTIEGKTFTGERALFQTRDAEILSCRFEDGESPLKESRNLVLKNDAFAWKYPLWYGKRISVTDCAFLPGARAGVWYTENASFSNLVYEAPKGFRACKGLAIRNVEFVNAEETLWWNEGVEMVDVKARNAAYFGMYMKNAHIENLDLVGDYAFDHAENIIISHSVLKTKDAFWNAKNVTLAGCVVEGEYFAWNATNLALIDCKVVSHQGFCYISGLRIQNGDLSGTDLCFEYCSRIDATLSSSPVSIKNPVSGRISLPSKAEIIQDDPGIDRNGVEIIVA